MPQQHGMLLAKMIHDGQHVAAQLIIAVGFHRGRPAAAPVAAHVQRHRPVTGFGQRRELVTPAIPEPGIAVAHDHQRPFSLRYKV